MAFSDFKNIDDAQRKYHIVYAEDQFIASTKKTPSTAFLDDLSFSKKNIDIFTSEASRSEVIISPVLRELYKHHYKTMSFWIQKSITYDGILTGTPDYLFAKKSALGKTVLEHPIVIVVEAKKNDFEHGWGQCLAELVATQKINQDDQQSVYGIVTDGNLWQFGKLTANQFVKNTVDFTIGEIEQLFGALDFIASEIAITLKD